MKDRGRFCAKQIKIKCDGCGQVFVRNRSYALNRRPDCKKFYHSGACFQKYGCYTKGPRWTEEHIQYLRENYRDMLQKDMAAHLGRTENAVSAKLSEMGWVVAKKWTAQEIQYLRENAGKITVKEMARVLGRSKSTVHNMGRYYGIPSFALKEVAPPITPEQETEISRLYDLAYLDKDIAPLVGVTASQVRTWRCKHSLANNRHRNAEALRAQRPPYRPPPPPPGVCNRCRKRPPLDGIKMCERCRDYQREKGQRCYVKKYGEPKTEFVCDWCSVKFRGKGNRHYCSPECYQESRLDYAHNYERQKQRRAMHLRLMSQIEDAKEHLAQGGDHDQPGRVDDPQHADGDAGG